MNIRRELDSKFDGGAYRLFWVAHNRKQYHMTDSFMSLRQEPMVQSKGSGLDNSVLITLRYANGQISGTRWAEPQGVLSRKLIDAPVKFQALRYIGPRTFNKALSTLQCQIT